jgi:outer membrane protein assembly factor BamB
MTIATPFVRDGHAYGPCAEGQFRCVEVATGKRVWDTLAPTTGGKPAVWGTAFVVAHGDRYFLLSERGHLVTARLSPKGYEELGRVELLAPTQPTGGRKVVWSHPAFANRAVYARNDGELVSVSLAK